MVGGGQSCQLSALHLKRVRSNREKTEGEGHPLGRRGLTRVIDMWFQAVPDHLRPIFCLKCNTGLVHSEYFQYTFSSSLASPKCTYLIPFFLATVSHRIMWTSRECRHFKLWSNLCHHRWPQDQQNYVFKSKFDRAIKRRLTFENQPRSFGGVSKETSQSVALWEISQSGAVLQKKNRKLMNRSIEIWKEVGR